TRRLGEADDLDAGRRLARRAGAARGGGGGSAGGGLLARTAARTRDESENAQQDGEASDLQQIPPCCCANPPQSARAATYSNARWVRQHSDLAARAVVRRAAAPLDLFDDVPAPAARLAVAPVDLVLGLVLPDVAVEIAVLLVGQRRAAHLDRLLQDLAHGAVQPTDLLRRQRLAAAVVAQAGVPQDLVA